MLNCDLRRQVSRKSAFEVEAPVMIIIIGDTRIISNQNIMNKSKKS